jgi:hypothetical protein
MISQIFSRIKQLIVAHWRGELPVMMTMLVTVIGLRWLLELVQTGENTIIAIILISVNVLILAWQVVGLSRCADQHLKSTGDMMMYWAANIVMLLAIVMTVLQVLDLSAGPAPKITAESLRNKPLPLLSEDGRTIFLVGEIDYRLEADVLLLLEQSPEITTVELKSTGGLIYAARALAITIEKHQLNTHVNDECNSACTLVFMAGKSRTLGEVGKIGFHQYEFQKLHPLQVEQVTSEQEKDQQYLKKRGVSADFIEQAYQSKHDEIWWPDHSVLLRAGVITQN